MTEPIEEAPEDSLGVEEDGLGVGPEEESEDPNNLPASVIIDLLASIAGSLATIANTLKEIRVDMRGGGSTPEFISGPNGGRSATQKTMFDTPNKSNKPPMGPTCPLCGIPMAYRKGSHGPFWGCSNYPRCKHTEKCREEG